jgi:nucleoid DNA-binding protein
MAAVTKRDLVQSLSTKTGLTQQQVQDVMHGMLEEITRHLAEGDYVTMRNFGTFQLRRTKARIGRNPAKPLKDVAIPERTVVRFKAGKDLQNRVADTKPRPD